MLKRLENRLRRILPAEFRKMELEAATVTSALASDFRRNFEHALIAMDKLTAHPDFGSAAWRRQLYLMSHDLRGLGSTFDYDLITIIGEALCILIDDANLPGNRLLQRRLIAHVAALKAVQRFDLKDDGGAEGVDLLTTLKIARTKHPSLEPGAEPPAKEVTAI